jgi:hypothetical protein
VTREGNEAKKKQIRHTACQNHERVRDDIRSSLAGPSPSPQKEQKSEQLIENKGAVRAEAVQKSAENCRRVRNVLKTKDGNLRFGAMRGAGRRF